MCLRFDPFHSVFLSRETIKRSDVTDEDLCIVSNSEEEKSLRSNFLAPSAFLNCGEGRGQTSVPSVRVTNKCDQEVIFQGKVVPLSMIIIDDCFCLKSIEKGDSGKKCSSRS